MYTDYRYGQVVHFSRHTITEVQALVAYVNDHKIDEYGWDKAIIMTARFKVVQINPVYVRFFHYTSRKEQANILCQRIIFYVFFKDFNSFFGKYNVVGQLVRAINNYKDFYIS